MLSAVLRRPASQESVLVLLKWIEYGGYMYGNLNALNGVYSGLYRRVIKGDSRSLDYGSFGDNGT